MRAALLIALMLPSLAHSDGQLTIVDPDIDTPQTDAQIAERLCGAFMQHPRLSKNLTNCFSHVEGGDLDIYGREITEQDLADLCTSVLAKPAPAGNIAMTAHNEDGSTVAIRCFARGGFIRRVPIEDICSRLMARPPDVGSMSSCSVSDDGKISVQGAGLERSSLVQLCSAIGEPAALGNMEIVSRDKTGSHISAGCQVNTAPAHLEHPKD